MDPTTAAQMINRTQAGPHAGMYVCMYVCMWLRPSGEEADGTDTTLHHPPEWEGDELGNKYTYVCMYVCMHACMYVYIHVCMYVCKSCGCWKYKRPRYILYMHTHTYIHTYIHNNISSVEDDPYPS